MSVESAIAMWVVTPTYTTGRSKTHGRHRPADEASHRTASAAGGASIRDGVSRQPEYRLERLFDDDACVRFGPRGIDDPGGCRRHPLPQTGLRLDPLVGVPLGRPATDQPLALDQRVALDQPDLIAQGRQAAFDQPDRLDHDGVRAVSRRAIHDGQDPGPDGGMDDRL